MTYHQAIAATLTAELKRRPVGKCRKAKWAHLLKLARYTARALHGTVK